MQNYWGLHRCKAGWRRCRHRDRRRLMPLSGVSGTAGRKLRLIIIAGSLTVVVSALLMCARHHRQHVRQQRVASFILRGIGIAW